MQRDILCHRKENADTTDHYTLTVRYTMYKALAVVGLVFLLQVSGSAQPTYNPRYWIEGSNDVWQRRDEGDPRVLARVCDSIYARGWRGITYWGADRDGAKMDYYFKSPFLEKQGWAVFKRDGLSSRVKAAHASGLKVVINIEGVNPWHWKKNQWTAENIKAVAEDLANDGVDAVFEECFEVKPAVFTSLANTLKERGVDYISGTDPMLLREAHFVPLWPLTGTINIYNYYLKRDKIFNIATLAEHGSLGFGWAKYWGKPTSFISPLTRNWGIPTDYSPAVVMYLCMIRALQFRVDNFMIWGGMDSFDPLATQSWIDRYVEKQEKERPLLDIVVLLRQHTENSGTDVGDPGWNRLFNSGDAITSGAFNAGYNIIVSDKVVPADAYWIYAIGGKNDALPSEVVALFDSKKPVFLQSGNAIPSGDAITPSWKTALDRCGIDGTRPFRYGGKAEGEGGEEVSLPANQESELPYTGYYNGTYLRFTGSDAQRGSDMRAGTVIPKEAIKGTVYAEPNKTYGRGPYIVGKDSKYLVTATTLNWEVSYPISHLLSGGGILPSSNVWGIVGKNVTGLLAIETTELDLTIPGLADGSKIHVVVWDKTKKVTSDETVVYKAPYKRMLREYDFLLIDKAQ
jgi:hypothetical protein